MEIEIEDFVRRYEQAVESVPSQAMAIMYGMNVIAQLNMSRFIIDLLSPAIIPQSLLYEMILCANAGCMFLSDKTPQVKDMTLECNPQNLADKIKFVSDHVHKLIYEGKILEGKND